ncbi:MAG: alpha/beta hydrolase [Pseudomonadota bacterium]|nr:alpha/beta hydrolase [Pseudomonadota bacterium]
MDQKRVPDGWDKEKALVEGVRLNVERKGSGHPLFLFHGGMGSWTHWIRNIDVLAEHFEVRAVDAPSYGESEQVDYGLTPQEYLQVFIASIAKLVADDESFSVAGFSFGGACGSAIASYFADKVRAVTVIGPGGFSIKGRPRLDFIKYSEVRGDPKAYRHALGHNLLQLMLKHPSSLSEEVLDMQHDNVDRARFNSRNVSGQSILPENLGKAGCPAQLIYGDADPTAFPSIEHRANLIREHVSDFRLHVLPNVGHWAMFEGCDAVNRLIIDFHKDA